MKKENEFNEFTSTFPDLINFNQNELASSLQVNCFTSNLQGIQHVHNLDNDISISYLIDHISVTFKKSKQIFNSLLDTFFSEYRIIEPINYYSKTIINSEGMRLSFALLKENNDEGLYFILPGSSCSFNNLNKVLGLIDYCQNMNQQVEVKKMSAK